MFSSGMGIHITEKQPQVCKFSPFIARHSSQQRTFAMHYFIVRKWKHKVLCERIHDAEGDLVMMILPVNRILLEITERVVHPAHHPLLSEAQSSQISGARYTAPGSRFL